MMRGKMANETPFYDEETDSTSSARRFFAC
jgi:hypothetical protein